MFGQESSSLRFNCENKDCDNKFSAHIIEHKGGVNDYGWWIIKCDKCQTVFDAYIGRDVNDSSLTSGGTILEKLDKEIYSEEEVKAAVKAHSNTN